MKKIISLSFCFLAVSSVSFANNALIQRVPLCFVPTLAMLQQVLKSRGFIVENSAASTVLQMTKRSSSCDVGTDNCLRDFKYTQSVRVEQVDDGFHVDFFRRAVSFVHDVIAVAVDKDGNQVLSTVGSFRTFKADKRVTSDSVDLEVVCKQLSRNIDR